MGKKVVIVGGVAGGASAAARLRRIDENAEIILLERGEHISFANCGLPYHIGEVITERSKLLVQTPEAMKKRFNIDVRVLNEVIAIDRENKVVKIKNHKTGETYTESYDYLILSPGANPVKPPIPGIDHPNIFTLRNIPDMDKIKGYIDNKKPKSAIVVGGGFIGLEMAENLHHRGLNVTIVEMADQVMAPLDFEMAAIVHEHIRSKNVNLILKDGVKSFKDRSGQVQVTLQSGKEITADLVILAIGVRPDTTLAKSCGLELGKRGGIKVNEYLQTSDPSIYAIGDAIEVEDFITKKNTLIPLAGPANKQGRIVANNIAGRPETYKGTQGTAIAKVFDLTVASTGANEKTLKREGIKYIASITHSGSHAGYYPGAIPMSIKILFTPEGKLLGAQIVGYKGVDKRIDVLATAIRFGKTVFDLQELELAYAPPFSSAKDPVNMAGYAAGNIINGDTDIIHWHEIPKLDLNKSVLVDVRTKMEWNLGAIEGAILIPVDELRDRLNELPKDKEIIIYCQVGLRGYIASRILKQHGFTKVKNLSGGYKTYKTVIKELNLQNDSTNSTSGSSCCNVVEKETVNAKEAVISTQETVKLDACGLQCPGPIMQVYQKMKHLKDGQVLEVRATDPGFVTDIPAWCKRTGNKLLKQEKTDNCFIAYIQKGGGKNQEMTNQVTNLPQDKTIIIFSGDLDKAIASFIIANGAASMGRKVTMFFTFWGLNILRKNQKVKVKKGFLDKMFGMMMPRGSKKLGLSKMNMMGIGPKMIRYVMKKKGVDSLEALIGQAKMAGVRLVACQMSMDVMGIKKEELIDGVEIGGVANYLGAAEESNVNLFI
ncbi:pyridine nucleotide-disulfide oxidoreductase [Anoxybacter fermentans]|uniref:Pyridine nucleotide-disulfide oxidoreductase n=1 Tax=Anoxybacter fermentans TaxID=1323375 RepID=A0A3Q9HS29_9FIRM|nr:CoA-disulfide reductase [Anoxybacter fermentans]AZR74326.1 pyridine nucleotide-disulfide oxidoreductase [Anoxybacter fermentans]